MSLIYTLARLAVHAGAKSDDFGVRAANLALRSTVQERPAEQFPGGIPRERCDEPYVSRDLVAGQLSGAEDFQVSLRQRRSLKEFDEGRRNLPPVFIRRADDARVLDR